MWGMRRNPTGWSETQIDAMYWLQRANLKTARAWRLKMALREVFARARTHNDAQLASADLKAWISWARRCRLESFKRLGATLKSHFDAVVRGMLDHRSNAFVEAMNGLMQQARARCTRLSNSGELHRHRVPAAGPSSLICRHRRSSRPRPDQPG